MESGNTSVGSEPPPAPDATAAAKPKPKIPRWAWLIFAVCMLGIGAMQIYTGIYDSFTLPTCDSQRAKDSLSNVFKEHKFEPVRYESVQTVSSNKDEVVCNAVLPLKDGNKLAADYTFYWEGNTAKLKFFLHDAELPACDSQHAKDAMDAVFKERNFNPLRYESIKTVSSTKDEVVCNAVLPLPDGVNLVADFTFFWDNKQPKYKYELRRRAP